MTETKPDRKEGKLKNDHLDDETAILFVEQALAWTECLFPKESIKKLDHIIAGNLFITFSIDYKKTREIRLHQGKLANK